MSARQVVELSCDSCERARCPYVLRIFTNSYRQARYSALTMYGWSVNRRASSTHVVDDLCLACTDWGEPEAVVRTTLTEINALGQLERALALVSEIVGIPSGA